MGKRINRFKNRFNHNATRDEAMRFLIIGIPIMLIIVIVAVNLLRWVFAAILGGLA